MKKCIRIAVLLETFVFFCFFFKHELAQGSYETKGYPLIHIIDNNNIYGSSNYSVKTNLINLLYIYKDIEFSENSLSIEDLTNMQDEAKIERIIKEKVQYINKFVNKRLTVKFSVFIYLYEIVEKYNFYFLIHFIMKNNNNGIIIILPDNLHVDTDEFFRINKLKEDNDLTNEQLEKRILFIQGIILNLKLNQSIFFIQNNKEIEQIYENYKNKFGFFNLTRSVRVKIPSIQSIYKLNSKNLFFFLSKDNIHINLLFDKQQNNETFILAKKKTIIICADYNIFNIISGFSTRTTSINSSIIAMNELIKLLSQVYTNEEINYNILFFFTNYYYGIEQFVNNINATFKDNIEFIICLDSLNEQDFYIYETKKNQTEKVLLFYDILKQRVKANLNIEIKTETNKIKIHNKHLSKIHEYFVLKSLSSFSLGSKQNLFTFLKKIPIIEQQLNVSNLKNNIKSIFESLYIYIKGHQEHIEEENIQDRMSDYTKLVDNDKLSLQDENLNKYNKFFIYKDDIAKLFNYLNYVINQYIKESNFLITDFKIIHDKKQKYFYQNYANVSFAMSISYTFHYIHFLFVSIFLIIMYIFVNFYLVPSFYKKTIKST